VAYLDRRDPAHEQAAEFLDDFKGMMGTTGAVVSEVMYFVSEFRNGPLAFAQLLVDSGIHVAECARPDQVMSAAKLMTRYADTPMDFADATLVQLAEETGVTDILTTDRRGFATYRTQKGKAFRLVLAS